MLVAELRRLGLPSSTESLVGGSRRKKRDAYLDAAPATGRSDAKEIGAFLETVEGEGAWTRYDLATSLGWNLPGMETATEILDRQLREYGLMLSTDARGERYVPDLLRDRAVMAVDRQFALFAVLAFAIPFALGFALSGLELMAGVSALFWAGLVRVGLTHHVTWSVNSICHMFGRRPFDTTDRSTNNWVLALPTMGEAWHHNHHAFPTSAFHGLTRWQFALDPSGWVIWALERLHLAWDVKRVSGDQIAAKTP